MRSSNGMSSLSAQPEHLPISYNIILQSTNFDNQEYNVTFLINVNISALLMVLMCNFTASKTRSSTTAPRELCFYFNPKFSRSSKTGTHDYRLGITARLRAACLRGKNRARLPCRAHVSLTKHLISKRLIQEIGRLKRWVFDIKLQNCVHSFNKKWGKLDGYKLAPI